ncbi:AAA family ATPase [Marinimicrobium agarilyticum]|uniref:AAA family ATPase n=1 Tax=Marinimicrobium agarilyticum TaxID=306546 RepID=UPI00042828AC|nr:AAA family ATPase [Marinimicrobium agarilyticum]
MHSADTEASDTALADYRQYYGLTEDPFQDDVEFTFFGGAGRRALLEQLQHLCQFSASFLAVLGKPGVGKSRVALELANSFEPDDEICLLNAEPGVEAADVLGQMVRHFSLPLEGEPSIGRLLAALRHFAQVADEEDRLALTIIDDAHHLDEKTLGALISLLQGQDASGRRLHIVLFAEPEMVTRLDQFNMHDVLIHDFELASFSLEEATDYLNFRMEMSDYMGPEVFTEEQVEPWWRRAEGRLPRLHHQARQWLLESVTPRQSKPGGRPPLPVVHIVVVAVLLGVLLMVFLYRGDAEEEATRETVSAPREAQPVTLPAREKRLEADAGADVVVPAEENHSLTSLPSEMPSPETIEVEPSTLPSEGTDGDSSAEASEAPVDKTVQSQRSAASKPGSSESSAAPAPKASALPDIPEDEQVILSWRPSDYTLQLLGASSRESVQRYLSEQPNRAQLLSFESRRQGEPWFVVVTGRYSSSEAARQAITQLPSTQRSAGPWPRVVEDIQGEIKALRNLSR